jgi:hypothetical protein
VRKNKACRFIGNVFIEFADRWFFVFDGPWEYDKPWTLRTYLAFLPGFISIIIGCLFYSWVDEKY